MAKAIIYAHMVPIRLTRKAPSLGSALSKSARVRPTSMASASGSITSAPPAPPAPFIWSDKGTNTAANTLIAPYSRKSTTASPSRLRQRNDHRLGICVDMMTPSSRVTTRFVVSRHLCFYVTLSLGQAVCFLNITKMAPFHLCLPSQMSFQFSLPPLSKPSFPCQLDKSSVTSLIFQNHNQVWIVLLLFLILAPNMLYLSNKPPLLHFACQLSTGASHTDQ